MKLKLTLLAALALGVIAAFLFVDLPHNWDYALERRIKKVLAITLTGGAIAYATLIFQTITNNRILTPNVIGLDSLYMLIQTVVIFAFGVVSLPSTNKMLNFGFTVGIMLIFVGILYKLIFKREGRSNLFFLLLIGLVMGTMFGSMTTFMQVLIDPNDFLVVQGKMFASFNNVNSDLLVLSIILLALVALYALRFSKYLDAMSLGREHAVNLGIPYNFVVMNLLVIVAILIAVSTALVGPITFLGLLVVNVGYQFMKTYRHSILVPSTMLISIIALVGGQMIVERVFTFETTVSVIINFIGGIYFLYLLLRESKS
ncbi:iron chelate uptake ABC transporter family permease subunit [Paenibacillus sp. NPDC057967]|uniref:iron chelate uptake ABC transporter family permease subunit n=1 Tax=Paenibacillus sp. NPDC057967 TaxID=3346293 RepID=UPI0036DC922E